MFFQNYFDKFANCHNRIIESYDRYEDIGLFLISKKNSEDDKSLILFDFAYFSFIFDVIPKHFTITTNSNIPHKFNIELLKDTSSTISDLLNESPDLLKYHINIDDEKDVLGKFEKIYQGKPTFFEDNEKYTVDTIITLLGIDRCPDIMKNSDQNFTIDTYFGLFISDFKDYLKNEALQTFTIITRKNEYKCNVFGICSSKILLDLVHKDPFINEYKYDFDDEFNEFQQISDLFNFKKIEITNANMYALRDIFNDLQINVFIEKVEKFIENSKKFSQTIDDQQSIIDSNEELFEWLYHIKERNVETVKKFIIHSNWIKTEEKVQELVAFILQVISTDSTIQTYIIDLIIELEKETKNLICLSTFLISKLNAKVLGTNLNDCCFVYKLYQAKIITKEKLICMIKYALKMYHKSNKITILDLDQIKIEYLVNWFYPEINENDEIKNQIGTEKMKKYADLFINKYYNNNINGYLKMRDNGEPDDELTKALRNDDIDTFQRILIERNLLNFDRNINISNAQIPYNLYENSDMNKTKNYINYACAYGSVKCFKYLLLNHSMIDIYLFSDAVFGGNIEIIKTVDQILQKNKTAIYEGSIKISMITSIMKHQNEVFDWIFQEKYLNRNIDKSSMKDIMICAAKNGNAHAFIEIIDVVINNGFDFISNAINIFYEISKNGFYLMTKLFFNIFRKLNAKENNFLHFSYSTSFGNISIFKESFDNMNFEYELIEALETAIKCKYMNIIEYFINKLINTKFKNSNKTVFACLYTSLSKSSDDLFNYFIVQFKKLNPNCFVEFDVFNFLLAKACNKKNIKIIKKIIDMIVEYNHEKEDFTTSFKCAIATNDIEICKYFIDNKLFINYEKLSVQINTLSIVNNEIFSFIIENASDEEKCMFLNKNFLEQAIENKNIGLIEYLIESKIVSEKSLFLAVSSNDVEVVNTILKYNSKPSFINKVSENGTVLCIAAYNQNLSIVKRLLSIPGIDPDLYDKNKKTPFILGINDLEIINEFLNFYDKESNIKNAWQFNKALKMVLINLMEDIYPKYIYPSENNASNYIPILMRILEFKEIDPNYFVRDYTALLYACQKNRIDVVKILLQNQKIDVNLYSPKDGNTPLMVSILNGNFEIAKMLIDDPRTNLNAKNFYNESALILSVNKQLENIVDLLIHDERFDPEESNINDAFYFSSGNISCLLSSIKSIDVNHQYNKTIKKETFCNIIISDNFEQKALILFTTALLDSVGKNDIEKVDLIINHPSFDRAKSLLIKSIFVAVENGYFEIFKKLIKINDDDVNIHDSNKKNLLNFAVVNKRAEIVDYILDSQNFDPTICDIFAAFTFYIKNVTKESFYMMNKLYKYDKMKTINFNQLLPSGESFFTLIASQIFTTSEFLFVNSTLVGEIAFFLIDHRVDPNMPDRRGIYPLEYAILLESTDFVRILLNSNKINLNQIIEIKDTQNRIFKNLFEGCLEDSNAVKKTYLHIAARSRVLDILKLLVEIDGIDINSKDEFGETPLFDACRFNRLINIEYLASLKTVDFDCCNCDGNDVLKVSIKLMAKKPDFDIQNREDYAKALSLIFKRNHDYIDFDNVD